MSQEAGSALASAPALFRCDDEVSCRMDGRCRRIRRTRDEGLCAKDVEGCMS